MGRCCWKDGYADDGPPPNIAGDDSDPYGRDDGPESTNGQDLRRLVQEADALMTVAATDVRTWRRMQIADREMHHAASTMKTPVIIDMFRRVQAVALRLDSAAYDIFDGDQ